ncbi:hypothetical protein BJ875DRAFT_525696 [Amylocarpus encephaloides]|uniref:2EXR domain-containing protein n=1 Tax=Amylocarpus encephaloides TaxID=45428 RepID=A0A9P8C778_9HELO|nr:hypothetical protein BJ875DRAFT_525696 [Amylocarpus encephaloides]
MDLEDQFINTILQTNTDQLGFSSDMIDHVRKKYRQNIGKVTDTMAQGSASHPSKMYFTPKAWKAIPEKAPSKPRCTCFRQTFINWPCSEDGSFVFFPMLPPELRLKVWGAALPGPRVVDVAILEYPSKYGTNMYAQEFNTDNPGIQLLHACRESRALFFKHYHPLKILQLPVSHGIIDDFDREQTDAMELNPRTPPPVYIDEMRDTFLFRTRLVSSTENGESVVYLSNLRKIATLEEGAFFNINDQSFFSWNYIQKSCPMLVEFSIILNADNGYQTAVPNFNIQLVSMTNASEDYYIQNTSYDHYDTTPKFPLSSSSRVTHGNFMILLNKARRLNRLFKQNKVVDQSIWGNIEFNASVYAYRDFEWWHARNIPLEPLDLEVDQRPYYTLQPVERAGGEHFIIGTRDGIFVLEKYDGAFTTIYDGIAEMFAETSLEDAKKGGNMEQETSPDRPIQIAKRARTGRVWWPLQRCELTEGHETR